MKKSPFLIAALLGLVLTGGSIGQTTVELTVDQSQSFVTVSVLGGSDMTTIVGDAVVELDTATVPFGTAHITELNMSMADGFSITLLAGTVVISVDPGGATVTFVQVGDPGAVNAINQFDQVGNLFGVTGQSMVQSPFGDETIDLSTVKPVPFDIVGAELVVDGLELTLLAEVNIDFDFDVLGGTATMNLNGPLVLNGMLPDDMIMLGDVNCDGVVDLLDVAPFVGFVTSGDFFEKADINLDGTVNLLDVQPFVELLTGG